MPFNQRHECIIPLQPAFHWWDGFRNITNMIALDGASLSLEDVVAVARNGATVRLAAAAAERMERSRARVDQALSGSRSVYALNTGVGLLANIRLDEADIEAMQVNLIRSHCCGVGETA